MKKLKKAVLGVLELCARATLYLPRPGEHTAIRAIKVGALAYSAYESFKPEEKKQECKCCNKEDAEELKDE